MNPIIGHTTVTLADGKPHQLRYDVNALASFEEAVGKSLQTIAASAKPGGGGDIGIRDLRALLWAGLLHRNRRLTLEDAGNLIDLDPAKLAELGQTITDAITLAFPSAARAAEDGEEGGKPSGTGSPSSKPPVARESA